MITILMIIVLLYLHVWVSNDIFNDPCSLNHDGLQPVYCIVLYCVNALVCHVNDGHVRISINKKYINH